MSPAEKLRLMESFDVRQAIMSIVSSKDFLMEEVVNQVIDQMEHGLNGDGKKIGKYDVKNSTYYARKKYEINPLAGYGYVDLMYTHDFVRNLFAEINGDSIHIDSTDWKSEMLQDEYGENIMNLNKGSKTILGELIAIKLIKKLSDEVGVR